MFPFIHCLALFSFTWFIHFLFLFKNCANSIYLLRLFFTECKIKCFYKCYFFICVSCHLWKVVAGSSAGVVFHDEFHKKAKEDSGESRRGPLPHLKSWKRASGKRTGYKCTRTTYHFSINSICNVLGEKSTSIFFLISTNVIFITTFPSASYFSC